MKRVVDAVNLNSDASCLASNTWLEILSGGKESTFMKWLRNFAETGKKISLGIIGNTLADIANYNPEAIAFINAHRNIFEIILRPFSHDIALLRSHEGFEVNFSYGQKALLKEFGSVFPYFLPPEFMLTNIQVSILSENGVKGVFVNSSRFNQETSAKIPKTPYMMMGAGGTHLQCIPFSGSLTRTYLDSIHIYDASPWNKEIERLTEDVLFSWRDGESAFLIPDGISRERDWLKTESSKVERVFLSDVTGGLQWQTPQPTDLTRSGTTRFTPSLPG
jgi:hypothetical protein